MAQASHIRAYKKLLRDGGATSVDVQRRRKHQMLSFSVNGRQHNITICLTPSDWRSRKNELAHIRRALREGGAA